MVVVHVPSSLGRLFGDVPGRLSLTEAPLPGTVADVIDVLDARWPGMRDRLCEEGPALRRHINVYVDRQPAALDTPVGPDSEVHILPAVAGG